MNVGVLGTGVVGRTLGTGFAGRGHTVKMGTRDPANETATAWAAEVGDRASVGMFAEAAAFGDVVVLATSWSGAENAIRLAGPENVAGKVVIDATNPLVFTAPDQPPGLALGHTDSAGEQVQRWLSEARVVKAFNTVGSPHMIDPDLPGGPPDMFICGNDPDAKATVAGILTDFGWPAVDIGGIEGSRLLEPLAILWVLYGATTGTWDHGFKLLHR